jgi:ATP-dependent Zn protease
LDPSGARKLFHQNWNTAWSVGYYQPKAYSEKVETIPYNQFKQYLAEGDVSKLTIGPQKISGTLKGKAKKPGKPFTTVRVNDPGLAKDLDEHKDSGGWDGLRMGVKSETVVVHGRPQAAIDKE